MRRITVQPTYCLRSKRCQLYTLEETKQGRAIGVTAVPCTPPHTAGGRWGAQRSMQSLVACTHLWAGLVLKEPVVGPPMALTRRPENHDPPIFDFLLFLCI